MIHLDTNILIALTKADSTARAWLTAQSKLGEEFCVSSITWYEFLVGPVLSHQIQDIEIILDSAPIPFDTTLAEKSAKYFNKTGRARKRKTDTMIAATAILHGGKLATRNIVDFKLFEPLGLTLIEV